MSLIESQLIGKIERIPLRDVWPHEAHRFTKWLEENIDVLGEVIGQQLTVTDREASAGDFSVDLLAEDADGQKVIIENQLAKTDHDHLGKLLTYLAAFEARTAIWIAGEVRPEHTKAVAWLNDSTQASFFLLRAEAVRIGESKPALLLTPIVGPSQESKAIAKEKQESATRYRERKQFWEKLLEVASSKTSLHSNVSPSEYNWIGTGAGRYGLNFSYVIKQYEWRVELYIDVGDGDKNEELFDQLAAHRDAVERICSPLEWQRLEDKRACRITTPWGNGGYRSLQDDWPKIHTEMVNAMICLERAVSPVIKLLK